ncbi:hypothetical protein EVJ58_g1609 [Rhodofomes roseus]|uniref:Uncharacterized protein n=1 Tax=Rhodofomes roseus TaxID=34475 RepID=A0A4Y9YYL1_9APHY|nr:hypothetical protein EVJ58_g1609 [Rhodofomes roseus]
MSLAQPASQSDKRTPPPLKSATMRKWPRASLGLSTLTISSRPLPSPTPEVNYEQITEVAMAIAEQLGAMAQASQPVATDAPLMLASLEPTQVLALHTWLQDRYDWDDPNRMMFDEDVTAEDLARDIDDFEESFKTAAEFMASPAIWMYDTKGTIRTFCASTPRISTTALETFPSRYVNGEATVDIGMAPYESWTGKPFRKHSRASKMIFGVLGLAALTSPLSPTPNNALSPTF